VTIEEVKKYWNENVIGIEVTDKEPGTPEFFDELERYYDIKYREEELYARHADFAGKKLLEVGCGWGRDLIKYARNEAIVTAVDLTESGVALARKYLEYRGLKGDVRVASAEELPFEDNSFDVVICIGVLMCTPNIQKAIDEIYRVLRPGGEAVVMLYHKWSWYNLLVRVSGIGYETQGVDAPLIATHSRRDVRRLFGKFSSIKMHMTGFPMKTVKRHGLLVGLYNSIFVPAFNALPRRLTRSIGWHIYIDLRK
jgi:ubiquinone/menaquinone biosynthesis C-methylase UbiE